MVRDIEIGVGEKLYCVESIGQLNPGSWMGEKFFNTEREAREYFAIIPEFKDPKLQLVLREYTIKRPLKARLGIAGPQFSPSNGQLYVGDGFQIQILDGANWEINWKNNFERTEKDGLNYIKLLTK